VVQKATVPRRGFYLSALEGLSLLLLHTFGLLCRGTFYLQDSCAETPVFGQAREKYNGLEKVIAEQEQ
jgi:hypothetical protein